MQTNPFEFFVTIESTNETNMVFNLKFKNPEMVSRGNEMDSVSVFFAQPRIFISQLSLKQLEMPTQASKLRLKSLPPQITSEMSASIEGATDSSENIFTVMSSGNFVISLILGGSL